MCEFFFDQPKAVYYSGTNVNGKIILTTTEVKRIRGISITMRGEVRVRWTDRGSPCNNEQDAEQSAINYRGDKHYLHAQVQVEGETDFPAGVHEYTYTTPLPPLVPSSASGPYGHVAYEVELKVQVPSRMDIVYTHPITVIRPFLIRFDPSYMQPEIVQLKKSWINLCFNPFSPRQAKSKLSTEFPIYAPGQFISFELLLVNESNKDIDACVVQLIQIMAFKSQTPEIKINYVKNVIKEVSMDGALRFTTKLHKGFIQVPEIPPTTTLLIDLITVSYILKTVIGTEILRTNVGIGIGPFISHITNPNAIQTNQHPLTTVQPPVQLPVQYFPAVSPIGATETKKPCVHSKTDKGEEDHQPPTAPDDEEKRLIRESAPPMEASTSPIGEQTSLLSDAPSTSAICFAKDS